jgi:hypothetical protein
MEAILAGCAVTVTVAITVLIVFMVLGIIAMMVK